MSETLMVDVEESFLSVVEIGFSWRTLVVGSANVSDMFLFFSSEFLLMIFDLGLNDS